MDQQTDNIRIPSESFQTLISRLYQSVDVPEADADTVARMQVETDERGVYSHGTRALPGYVRGIIKGGINPKPAPRVLTEAPATALIDADNSLGHGAAACFAMMALPAKMIGFNTTKTGGASVVPHWLLRF